MDDYQYLDPDTDLSLQEYGEFLQARRDDLLAVAELYAACAHQEADAADGATTWYAHHWERYMDAATTVSRVRHELAAAGKLTPPPATASHRFAEGYDPV